MQQVGKIGQSHLRVDFRLVKVFCYVVINAEMRLPDIFLLAANREKKSSEFYLSLAALHPKGEVRTLLEKLASEELGHKNKVEQMYSEVAFHRLTVARLSSR